MKISRPTKTPKIATGRTKRSFWTYAAWVVVIVGFLPMVAAGALVYRLLRRYWPDRLLALVLAVVPLPLAFWAVVSTDFLARWPQVVLTVLMASLDFGPLQDQPVSVGDVFAVLLVAVLLGPIAGALYWAGRQWKRERNPFSGEDEREQRLSTEERRRRRVTQAAQKVRHTGKSKAVRKAVKPLAVGEGDAYGPLLGMWQRGDLPAAWRSGRRVRLPMDHPDNRHLVIFGATGLGKTEAAIGPVAEWAVKHGWQVIYVTCKEPTSVEKSSAPRLAALAEKYGTTYRALMPGISPYDPMRGNSDVVRDRLIRIQAWGDEYWAHLANLLVGLALDLNAAQGRTITNLPDLVYGLLRDQLQQMAKTSGDQRVRDLVAALGDSALSGAMMRYASMALHLRGWVAAKDAGGWSFEDADIICAELPMSSRAEAGTALMRLMMRDLGSYLADPNRRQVDAEGKQRRVLIVVEEVGAVAADPVVGREFVDQVERNRTAGGYTMMTAQDLLSLGDERVQSAITTNAAVLTYRQTAQAEAVANLAGTGRTTEAGADYNSDGTWEAQGVMRRQWASKVNPQWLRQLGQGEAFLISAGRFAKVVMTMSELGYGLPIGSHAVEQTQRQLAAATTAAAELGAAPPRSVKGTQRTELPPPRRPEGSKVRQVDERGNVWDLPPGLDDEPDDGIGY